MEAILRQTLVQSLQRRIAGQIKTPFNRLPCQDLFPLNGAGNHEPGPQSQSLHPPVFSGPIWIVPGGGPLKGMGGRAQSWELVSCSIGRHLGRASLKHEAGMLDALLQLASERSILTRDSCDFWHCLLFHFWLLGFNVVFFSQEQCVTGKFIT